MEEDDRLISVAGGAAIREHTVVKASYTPQIFSTDSGDADLVAMRAHITYSFRQNFRAGVASYLEGDWEAARTSLTNCQHETPYKVSGSSKRCNTVVVAGQAVLLLGAVPPGAVPPRFERQALDRRM